MLSLLLALTPAFTTAHAPQDAPPQFRAGVPVHEAYEVRELEPSERLVLGSWSGTAPAVLRVSDPHDMGSLSARAGRENVRLAFRPDGRELAMVGRAGDQACVFVNGEAGPSFDEIDARFGLRYHASGAGPTYVGRRGNAFFVVHNGVEGPAMAALADPPAVTFDGRDAVYAGERFTDGGAEWGLVQSGVFEPTAGAVRQLAVSPVADRLAYLTQDAERQWVVVVPGEAVRARAESFRFLADGRLTYVESVAGGERLVVGDEASRVVQQILDTVWTPDEQDWVFVADIDPASDPVWSDHPWPNGRAQLVVHGDLEVPLTPLFDHSFRRELQITPDGQHSAFIDRTREGMAVVVDGQRGPECARVHGLQLSADGGFSYVAQRGTQLLPVVDGVEGAPLELDFKAVVRAPTGGSTAVLVGRGQRARIVHDGVPGPEFDTIHWDAVAFGPAGQRLAYVGQRSDVPVRSFARTAPREPREPAELGTFLVVDGAAPRKLTDDTTSRTEVVPRFTGDGSQVTYTIELSDPEERDARGRPVAWTYLYVGEEPRLAWQGTGPRTIELSDDGAHWATWISRGREPARLVIDGIERADKLTPFVFDDPRASLGELPVGAPGPRGTFTADGHFEACVVVDGQLERWRFELR